MVVVVAMKRKAASDDIDNSEAQQLLEKAIPPNSKRTYKINLPPLDRPVRIYCDGIYDLFHYGHAKALEQAKKAFPNVYLLVGCCNDQLTHTKKGRTVMSAHERYESLRHCKWVDEVVEDAPWIVTQSFLDKFDIDYVAHDEVPYQSDGVADVYGDIKAKGKFLPTRRTEGISTSDLITRIVRDYDLFVRRNLDRGVPAKELNVGFLKETELNVKKQMEIIKNKWKEGEGYIKQNWAGTKEELIKPTIDFWEGRSQDLIKGFLSLFGNESAVTRLWKSKSRSGSPMPLQTGSSSSSSLALGPVSPMPLPSGSSPKRPRLSDDSEDQHETNGGTHSDHDHNGPSSSSTKGRRNSPRRNHK